MNIQKADKFTPPGRIYTHSKYAALCSGDTEKVRCQLEDGILSLEPGTRLMSGDNLKNTVYHFVLAASSAAESCTASGMEPGEAYDLSDLYILKADECRNTAEIQKLFSEMCLDFTERMKKISLESAGSLHIRKCICYIYENLGSDLSLKKLASEINLSPSYLSALFIREKKISLKQFVKEARVEAAKNLLKYSDASSFSVAMSLGFSTQSVFISVFREITGMTPGEYREQKDIFPE